MCTEACDFCGSSATKKLQYLSGEPVSLCDAGDCHDQFEELADQEQRVRLRIGSPVSTEHGTGVIVGKDLPESHLWRWIVQINEPIPMHKEMVDRFKDNQLCYFAKEVNPR